MFVFLFTLAALTGANAKKECVPQHTYNFTYNEDYTELLCNIQRKYGETAFESKSELIVYCRFIIYHKFHTFTNKFGIEKALNKLAYRKIVYSMADESFLIHKILIDFVSKNSQKKPIPHGEELKQILFEARSFYGTE